MEKKASIIICAYNEEKTIENVVKTCYKYNENSEILVIDDGSTDSTEEIMKELNDTVPFHYIRLDENHGKSYAMAVGVENAKYDVILFFDADITGIKEEHYRKLLWPIFSEEADMVLGQPSETLINYQINPFRGLTGERALLKKDIEPILDDIREIRFGIETYINLYYQAHGKTIKYTILDGLTHPTKYAKTTPVKATVEFINEGQEIALTLLKNYDLITKRIENSFDKTNKVIKEKITIIQTDMNQKIKSIIERINNV